MNEIIKSPESNDALPTIYSTANKGIQIESIIDYRKKGLTVYEIADLLGCSHTNIVNRLKPYNDELDTLDLYKSHRADIIALAGQKILKSITPDRLEKASAYQLAGMYGILYDKERLERGQSTQNLASFHADIAYLKSQGADPKEVD